MPYTGSSVQRSGKQIGCVGGKDFPFYGLQGIPVNSTISNLPNFFFPSLVNLMYRQQNWDYIFLRIIYDII